MFNKHEHLVFWLTPGWRVDTSGYYKDAANTLNNIPGLTLPELPFSLS